MLAHCTQDHRVLTRRFLVQRQDNIQVGVAACMVSSPPVVKLARSQLKQRLGFAGQLEGQRAESQCITGSCVHRASILQHLGC